MCFTMRHEKPDTKLLASYSMTGKDAGR